ncbi:hypothetical protein SUDANB108_00113 [Streptomyces sp. enrichment culture]
MRLPHHLKQPQTTPVLGRLDTEHGNVPAEVRHDTQCLERERAVDELWHSGVRCVLHQAHGHAPGQMPMEAISMGER